MTDRQQITWHRVDEGYRDPDLGGDADRLAGLHERILDIVEELQENVAALLPVNLIQFSQEIHRRRTTDRPSNNDVRAVVEQLRDIILQQIDFENYKNSKEYRDLAYLWCDKGLNADQAIKCLYDYIRTSKFLEALFYHLEDLESRDDEPIEMVDAGCGPIPLYGLMAAIKSKRVNVTCIEVNPLSARMARDIVNKLGLGGKVTIIEEDAETYQHCKDIDLFVTETMFAGLLGGEPMAQIYNNFSPQVKENGVMIPESTDVNVGLVDVNRYLRAGCMVEQTGTVGVNVNLPRACVLDKDNRVEIVEQTIPLDSLKHSRYTIMASSTLYLHNRRGVELQPFESVLTTPVDVSAETITIDDHEREECEAVVVRYCAGSHAGDTTRVSYVPKGGRT